MSLAADVSQPVKANLSERPHGPEFVSIFPFNVAFAWCEGEEKGEAGLLPGERALLGDSASARRRRDFALGRHCARTALAKLRDGVADDAEGSEAPAILRGEGRMPLWPEGVVGAITHTGGKAAAAVAAQTDYLGIGLDLERMARRAGKLAGRILRPEEQTELEGLSDEAREARVTLAFSAKESIYKALNPATGIYLGFQDARIEFLAPAGEAEGELRWRLHKACGPTLPEGFSGQGRFAVREAFVLTAVWVARP